MSGMRKVYWAAGILCVLGAWPVSAVWADTTNLEAITVEDTWWQEPSLTQDNWQVQTSQQPAQPESLSDSLKDVFFVESQQSSDYQSEPYIRGRGNTGVPVYIEGMRLNAAHPDSTNLMSMLDIGTVDVYRGAQGATLGIGAMSGAVVAHFKDPVFNTTHDFTASGFVDGSVSFFSKDGITTAAGATMANDKVSVSVSGGFSDFANYKDGNGDEVLHSGSDTNALNASVAIKTSEDSYVYARFMRSKANTEDPMSRFKNGSVWMYTDRPNDDGKYYFFGYKAKQLAGLSDVDLQVYGNDLHYDMDQKIEATQSNSRQLYRESETWGGKASAKKQLGNNLLSFSGEYSNMNITNGLRTWSSSGWSDWVKAFGITGGSQRDGALRVADDITVGKAFFKIAGGYEHVDRYVDSNVKTSALAKLVPAALLNQVKQHDTDASDDLFSGELKAGYRFNDAFVPYVKLSNSTRTPYFNEAYGNNPSTGSQIPNQDLDNETVWGADIGFDGKYNAFYYSTALYYQKYHNYIELAKTGYTTTAGLPILQYINLDDAYIYGAEALLGYKLGGDRFVKASYVYTYGQNETYDQPLAYIAPQKLTLRVGQRRQQGLGWSVEEVLVDSQDRISTINGELDSAGYAVTNAGINYTFGAWRWTKKTVVSLEVHNLFDTSYREHLDSPSSTAWYLPDDPGINARLSLRIEF